MLLRLKTLLVFTGSLLLLSVTTACSGTLNKENFPGFTQIGEIMDAKIPEASGIAESRRQAGLFWLINDSGNDNSVFAINTQGKRIGRVKLKGVKNKDWEDLAAFTYKGKPYLLIADIGDNGAKRKKLKLHFIKEPKAKHLSKNETHEIKPDWSLEFTYEDGARDAESIAVDVNQKKIFILSKRDKVPVLYELPLQKKPKKQQAMAKRVGNLKEIKKTAINDIRSLKYAPFSSQPTAMDISSDGMSAIVLTYINAYYYQQTDLDEGKSLFANKPIKIPLPYLEQAEAVCFDSKAENIFITSENLPAPLLKINLQERFASPVVPK